VTLQAFLMKVKHAETPFFKTLKRAAKGVLTANLPVPGFTLPFFRLLYRAQHFIALVWRRLVRFFYIEPVFRGRCASAGKRLEISRMPFVVGPTRIEIGNDVRFFGKVDVFSGRVLENPTLILKDRVEIGSAVLFVVNKEIIIEEDVNISSGVKLMDTDSHPRDAIARIADLGPPEDEIKPIRVCRYAWIGTNSFILKGVTIGEGAIIGVNSVVVSDIPPYSVAMGNPARVVLKDSRKAAAV
jgi:acetyltransferase-like isoleucine patch superfamily enzyme